MGEVSNNESIALPSLVWCRTRIIITKFMYNFGTFGVTVMNSAPRGGALINCDVSFVCVCVCVL
jgi:hypothetical protein